MPDGYHAYGCIMYFPEHPLADMHGLCRAIISSSSFAKALYGFRDCLKRSNVPDHLTLYTPSLPSRCQFLLESQSHIEREVLRNTRDAVYLCPLATMYLNMSVYQPMRYKLPRLARRMAKHTAKTGTKVPSHWSQDPHSGPKEPA